MNIPHDFSQWVGEKKAYAESLSNGELISMVRECFAKSSEEILYGFLENGLITEVLNGAALEVTLACIVLRDRCGGIDKVFEMLRPGCFLTSEEQVVVHDERLEGLYVSGACFKGRWIDPNDSERVRCCCCKRSHEVLSVQLQARCRDYLKCVHVVLRQTGNDVSARADWAAYTTLDHDVGFDFESEEAIKAVHRIQVANSEDSDGYGVSKLFIWPIPKITPLNVSDLPVWVYRNGVLDAWRETDYMGNKDSLKINCDYRRMRFLPSCLKVEYASCDDWAGFYLCDRAYNYFIPATYFHPPYPGGKNLLRANMLQFRARGDKGGERVSFFFGRCNGNIPDSAGRVANDVVLTKKWKTYRIDLRNLDLSRINTGFGFWVRGQDSPITFYVNRIFYKHSFWWERAFVRAGLLQSFPNLDEANNNAPVCCDRNGMIMPSFK